MLVPELNNSKRKNYLQNWLKARNSKSDSSREKFTHEEIKKDYQLEEYLKGRFTRYNFVACDKLTTSLRHESFRVNQTYNLLTIVAYDTKNVVGF